MHIFFTPDITDDSGEYILSEEESKHCTRVLRLKKGGHIQLANGNGKIYNASILNDNEKKCIVQITGTLVECNKQNHHLHIAIAPTKNIERFEWFLEKATEIGIDEITPLLCEHSERTTIKTDRLNKVIIAAMKQSFKAWLPKLNEPVKFNHFIKLRFDENKYIAHCHDIKYNQANNVNNFFGNCYKAGNSAVILIGPEGDFSESEVKNSINEGYREILLSESRLRTETAGIVACHTFNLINYAPGLR